MVNPSLVLDDPLARPSSTFPVLASPSSATASSRKQRQERSYSIDDTLVNPSSSVIGDGDDLTAVDLSLPGGKEKEKYSHDNVVMELHDRRTGSQQDLHAFPPRPSPAYNPTNTNPYSTATPQSMTLAATAPLAETSAAGMRRANSIQSRTSSVAPDQVFGTKPVGIIGRHKPREIVRIERDYSAGELCQFWSGWIWELEGRVSPTEFQNTLNELNTVLASAHDPYKSCFDNCLAILTLYLSPLLITSHYDREMRKFERVLERANRDIYNPAGLNILPPKRNAFLFLEVEYY